MQRLHSSPEEDQRVKAARLLDSIKKTTGFVPNAYADLSTHSPDALQFLMQIDGSIRRGSLNNREVEAIRLTVSEHAGCEYCVAAHTVVALRQGLSRDAIVSIRKGEPSGDSRIDALVTLVRTLVMSSGLLDIQALDAARSAGFSDAQITEVLLVIAGITFTNLFNRVNDTVLDFPAADALQS
jgi:AhpD family alkylhydroperoxidase